MKQVAPKSADQESLATTALCDYYVIVGFADKGGALLPAEITFVANEDLALEWAEEQVPSLAGIAAYRLRPCPDGDGYRRPLLLAATGRMPEGWDALPKDFLFQALPEIP